VNEPSDPDKQPEQPEPADAAETRRKRPARRRKTRPEIDHTVASPCVAICEYDENGLCRGCLRDANEIRDWIIMSREEKLAVLDRIADRRSSNPE